MSRSIGDEDPRLLPHQPREVDAGELDPRVGEHPEALEDGVDRPVEPVDLGEGLRFPHRGIGLLRGLYPTTEELHVGPHDRQRGAQRVGDHRDEVGPRLVDGPDRFQLGHRVALEPLLLHGARERPARVSRKPTSAAPNARESMVWTFSTPTTSSPHSMGTEHIEV